MTPPTEYVVYFGDDGQLRLQILKAEDSPIWIFHPEDASWEQQPATNNKQGANVPKHGELVDITAPEHGVEIEIRDDGTVIWISVDGVTVLRVCRIPLLVLKDNRDV